MVETKDNTESLRLAELHELNILDTEQEEVFDHLVFLAAQICQTPVALISIVDENRQWFKANYGLEDLKETDRSLSFCSHAIAQPKSILEIKDATQDVRFADNELVTEGFGIQFYAGAPLNTAKGNSLGTLCVIDNKPSGLNDDQRTALKILAGKATRAIEATRENQDLKKRNKHLVELVNRAGDSIYEMDEFGLLTFVNDPLCNLLGYSKEQLIGKHFFQFVYSEDIASVKNEVSNLLKSRAKIGRLDFRLQAKSGRLIWINQSASLIYDQNQRAIKTIGVGRDITKSRLLKSELEIAKLSVDLANVGIAWITEDAQVISYNEAYLNQRGFSEEFLKSNSVLDFAPNMSLERWKGIWNEVKEKGKLELNIHLTKPNDDRYDVELRLSHIEYNGKEFLLAASMDVTSAVKTTNLLKQSQELLNRTNHAADIGTWGVDLDTMSVTWSDVTREIHGMPEGHIPNLKHGIDFYLEGDSRERITKKFEALVNEQKPFDDEFQIVTGTGRVKWIRSIGLYEEHEIFGKRLYGVFHDIDKRKTYEQKLIQKSDELLKSYNELEDFVHLIAHDLKLPLDNISGLAHLGLLPDLEESQNANQLFGMIAKSVDKARSKIKETLSDSYSKKMLRFDESVDINVNLLEVVNEVVFEVENQLQEKQGEVILNIPSQLELPFEKLFLLSIIQNLVTNAIKYSSTERAPIVEISAEINQRYQITIADNGLGIDLAKDYDRLFTKGERLHNHVEGSGYGLALVKREVERVGGTIEVESTISQGSVFKVFLPK